VTELSEFSTTRVSKPVIDHPEPLSPVTADGVDVPKTLELYDRAIGTSAVTPGSVISWSTNKALPVPTSTS
jgi:hypothetical protein